MVLEEEKMTVSKELLEILACPKCKGDLEYVSDDRGEVLICRPCALVYLVKEGIPVMLIEEALSLEKWETGETV